MNAVLLSSAALLFLGTYCNAAACGCSSQKELPARIGGECDITYYKRIFPVDTSCGCKKELNEFYKSVFYKYIGETDEQYVSRIDVIFDKIYSDADCRTDSQKADVLKQYYSCKYGKKNNENDYEYFKRVLKKTSECASDYRIKVELMKRSVKSVDWSKVIIEENSSTGYSILEKTTDKKRRSEQDKDCECGVKEKRQNGKNVDSNIHYDGEKAYKTNVRQIEDKEKKHKGNVKEIQDRKLSHDHNIERIEAEKREHDANVKTVQEKKREHEINVDKVEASKRNHEKNVDKIEATKKEHEENVHQIAAKKREHKENVKNVEAYNREHEENINEIEENKKGHEANVKKIEEKEREHEENVIKWIKANYKRKSGESIDNYYKRICCRDSISDEEYVKRLTTARSLFRGLDLWYDEKYLSEIEYYYRLVYSRKESETEDEYWNRLLSKEDYESEEIYFKRLRLMQQLYPHLSCWYDKNVYETHTCKLYQNWYEKGVNEQDDVYLKRIFTKLSEESEEHFWMRIKLIKNTFPDYSCWYNKENIQFLNVCKSLYAVENIQELESKITLENTSDKCREIKTDCLRTFFESTESSC